MRILSRASVVAACTAVLVTPAMTAAAAEVSPSAECEGGRVVYRTTIAQTTFTQATGPNSAVTGPPGVTLEISTSDTYSVGGSVSASATVSADAVIASVSAEVGVTVSEDYSSTTSTSGAFTVPADWANGGRLALGTNVYSGVVSKYIENRACELVEDGNSATFDVPANEWQFQTTRL